MSVRLLDEAEREASEAARWYEDKRRGLGERFVDALELAFGRIEQSPLAAPLYPLSPPRKDIRQILLKPFPFVVVYQAGRSEQLVVAVAHTKRRPGYWKSRLPCSG